jgi:hypothetical protein
MNATLVADQNTGGGGTRAPSSSSSSAAIMYYGPLAGRYFRLNFTGAYTSGSSTGTIAF